MLNSAPPLSRQHGTSMMEVLVTILILALGMLGLAGLQSRIQLTEMEAYQRAQAVVLLADMTDSIFANAANAASYVTGTTSTNPLGTGTAKDCSAPATLADKDMCEWSDRLKGAAEVDSGGSKVGAMIGARGCIEQLQAPNAAATVCTPGKYRVTVTWQGLNATAAPSLTCGSGNYGGGNLQRVIASNLTIGLPNCL
jgi:type IV pilus assembly protein PilV